MKKAIMHCIARSAYNDLPQIIEVTSAKWGRIWGRDMDGRPTNVRAADVYVTIAGPDSGATAAALLGPVQVARDEMRAEIRLAYAAYDARAERARDKFRSDVAAACSAAGRGTAGPPK